LNPLQAIPEQSTDRAVISVAADETANDGWKGAPSDDARVAHR
jgi:hypothetical protein